MARIVLQANRGGQAGGVTILNGTSSTGYAISEANGINWGNYSPDLVYSIRKDGIATAVDYQLPPRAVQMPVRVLGTSYSNAILSIQTLGKEVLAVQRSGGRLTYIANGATYPVYLNVRGAKYETSYVSSRFEIHFRSDGMLELECDPAAYGDDMGFRDDFKTDTSTDYTQDAGAFTIASHKLGYASTGAKRFRHTARGYTYTDVQVTMKGTAGASVTTLDWAVMARCQGTADTALLARVVGAATNQIQFAKVAAGVITTLATAAFTPAVNTSYWIRLRLEGAVGTAEVFASEPKPLDAATATASATLSAADQQAYVGGLCGVRVNVIDTTERFDDFDVRPYTYRFTSPDRIRLTGIPGDIPANITSEVSVPSTLATQAVFGGSMWAQRCTNPNLCWNGNLEQTAAGNTNGWFSTTVAGVITAPGGATARDATASKFGSACIAFTTTAVANQGLNFPMPRRFKKGQTYIGMGWMQSAAGVGNVDLQLGLSGDIAASTVQALSTAWKFFTCAWTPTADRDVAYLAPRHVAATAETVRFDGGGVFEATPQTQNGGITNVATSMPLTAVPPEGNPPVPFFMVLEPGSANQEIVRVTAYDTAGTTYTIERAYDGTTAAAHATGTAAYALPGYWFDNYSDGVHGSLLDVVGLANPYATTNITTSMSADANARAAFTALSGNAATSTTATYLIDPSFMVPPDFTNDELLIETWLRFIPGAAAPAPNFKLYTRGEDGSATGGQRYDLENGSGGISILAPTSSVYRLARLGLAPVRYVDGTQRRRVQVAFQYDITSTGTTVAFDHAILHPAGQRATTPTGRLDDANYPDYLPTVSLQQTRRVNTDLVSEVGLARETMLFGNNNPQGGIIGAPQQFPAPNTDVIVKLSSKIPNGGVVGDGAEALSLASEATITATFNVTPRFLALR